MRNRVLNHGRLGAAILASTVLVAGSLMLALPAAAAAPSGAALTWTGDDGPGADPCMTYPCQGAAPSHPWSFSATTGGLALNDVVSFTFSSTTTDRLHAVAMPMTMSPDSIDVVMTNTTAPVDCYTVVDNTPTHPASVSLDWANQKISFPMPGSVAAGNVAQFCFTDNPAIGMPLTPTPDTTTYHVAYTEPGGTVSAGYRVLARTSTDSEPGPPMMHIVDAAAADVSNAGEAGTPKGFFNTTYTINLTGTPNTQYALYGLSGRGESAIGSDVVDPRVAIVCPASCTTSAGGTLAATFTVSAGTDDHFVIMADCANSDVSTPQCQFSDIGVISFTATARPLAPSPSPTASVLPVLPKAGGGSPIRPLWILWVVVAPVALAAVFSVRRAWVQRPAD